LYLLFFLFQDLHGPAPRLNLLQLKRSSWPPPPRLRKVHNLIIQEYGLVEEVDIYAANVFVKVRFFHRIKILNESVKANEAKERLRKMKQKAQFMFQ